MTAIGILLFFVGAFTHNVFIKTKDWRKYSDAGLWTAIVGFLLAGCGVFLFLWRAMP